MAELGEYKQAAVLLEDLSKVCSCMYAIRSITESSCSFCEAGDFVFEFTPVICRRNQVILMFSDCLEKLNMNSEIMMEVPLPTEILQRLVCLT